MKLNNSRIIKRKNLVIYLKIISILFTCFCFSNCRIFNIEKNNDNNNLIFALLYLNASFESYFSSAEIYDPNLNQFKLLSESMNSKRVGHRMTLLLNGKVLITGGYSDSEGNLDSAELFDPITETFITLPKMIEKRNIHTEILLNDGRVLLVGGQCVNGESSSKIVEVFNPSTSSFSIVGNLNYSRCSHSTSVLDDGSVLIIGGINPLTRLPLKEIEKFDITNSTITKVADLQFPRTAGVKSIKISNNKIAIIGGSDGNEVLKSIEIFNGNNGLVETGNDLQFIRNRPDVVQLQDGRILITSGVMKDNSIVTTSELMNPNTLVVSKVDSNINFPSDVRQPILLNNNRILLTGGYNQSRGGTQNQSEFFDPIPGQFLIGPNMNRARHGQIAIKLQNGKVLITGGRDLR
jgi:hypothetical protein